MNNEAYVIYPVVLAFIFVGGVFVYIMIRDMVGKIRVKFLGKEV